METKLFLKIARSRRVLIYLLLLHAVMLWTLWQLDMSAIIAFITSALLAVSLWFQLKKYQWLQSKSAIIEIAYQAADHNTDAFWTLHYAGGETRSPYQFVSSVVVAEMVIMRFRSGFQTIWWRRYETVLILAGSVPSDDFRRLRVMLRSINGYETK